MADERWAPAACVLPNGKQAIIAGGYSFAKQECVASVSLFDSNRKRFTPSKCSLPYPADFVMASPLSDGTVLLAGGFNDIWGSLDTAAIYDPQRDTCIPLENAMHERRELAQATPLSDGAVLITGGLNLDARTTLADAELYEPALHMFKYTAGPMLGDRFGHSACRLADGRVLVVGGTHWDLRKHESRVLTTAEIYDPALGKFHACAGTLIAARDRPTTTLLPDGNVLVAGGQGINSEPVTFTELYNPSTDRFTRITGASLEPRMAHSAVPLPSGDVLICGGWDAARHGTTGTCIVYHWREKQFTPAPELPFATHDLALLAFPSGLVLAAGGKSAQAATSASNNSGALLDFSSAK